MNNISVVAIGGGSPQSSEQFLQEAVDMAGVEHQTRVLIIPDSSTSLEKYESRVAKAKQLFIDKFQLPVTVLHEFASMASPQELEEKIASADVGYITGGNTPYMLAKWAYYGIDKLLAAKALQGLVLSGVSAGAIAPFAWGQCDPFIDRRANAGEYIAIDGLGLVQASVAPHFNRPQPDGKLRGEDFKDLFVSKNETSFLQHGFGIDQHAALVIVNGLIMARGLDRDSVTLFEATPGSSTIEEQRLTTDDSLLVAEL